MINGKKLVILCLTSIGVFVPALAGEIGDQPGPTAADVDCGGASLYLLLKLEGQPISFSALTDQLPTRPPEGYSMKQLRDAAGRFGLRLKGLSLRRDPPFPRSTALAFVNRESHGHFLVVRPVGHTGQMVQVFDGLGGPVVMDWTNLRKSSEWTGIVLIPDRPSWWIRIPQAIALAGLITITLMYFRARRRRSVVKAD